MMVLSTRPLSEVNFRAVGGRRLIDMHQQLTAVLRSRTKDPKIEHFLARPNINRRTDQLEWSTDLAGLQIDALTQLEDHQRDAVRQELTAYIARVEDIAAAYRESADRNKWADADLFSALVDGITDEDIFVVDGHPVIVDWGVDIAGVQSGPIELKSAVGMAVPPLPAAEEPVIAPLEPEPTQGRNGWRLAWWLLALALLLVILLLLSRGCAPVGLKAQAPGLVPQPQADTAVPGDDLDREADLRREIDGLNRTLRERALVCAAPPLQTRGEAQEQQEEARRLDERGVAVGEVTVLLYWETRHDLDLHVVTPSGTRVYHNNVTDGRGGRLDTDSNADKDNRTARAVEAISWPATPPTGEYQVFVRYYRSDMASADPSNPDSLASDYRVVVFVRGERKVLRGRIGPYPGNVKGPTEKVTTFVVE